MGEYELRNAYNNTLLDAAKNKEGSSSYNCGMLLCRDCPFHATIGHCTDKTLREGAGYKRTLQEWQQWWYEHTGERDTRTREQILSEDSNVDSADTAGADTLQAVVPTVDITWTTAVGKVEHRSGPMSLLCEEMHRFRKELSVWMKCMSRPVEQIGNSVAEQIVFTAIDCTGAVIAKCELFAKLFGKRKCWTDVVH